MACSPQRPGAAEWAALLPSGARACWSSLELLVGGLRIGLLVLCVWLHCVIWLVAAAAAAAENVESVAPVVLAGRRHVLCIHPCRELKSC